MTLDIFTIPKKINTLKNKKTQINVMNIILKHFQWSQ